MHGTHQMHKYIVSKHGWTDTQMGHIDWKCNPTKNIDIGKRIFISSYSHQWLPINVKLSERNLIGSHMCQMCDEFQETHMHFITCKCYKTNQNVPIRENILARVEKHNVDPYLQIILLRGIKASAEGGALLTHWGFQATTCLSYNNNRKWDGINSGMPDGQNDGTYGSHTFQGNSHHLAKNPMDK